MNSYASASNIVFKNLEHIIGFFESVSEYVYDKRRDGNNEKYTEKAKEDAGEFTTFYTDKNALIALPFGLDVQTLFGQVSLLFQERYSSLIGTSKIEEMIISTLDDIATGLGKNLKSFLDNCVCHATQRSPGVKCASIADYEAADKVFYKNIQLYENFQAQGTLYPKLSSYKNTYIELLKEELALHFPAQGNEKKGKLKMKLFDVLDQTKYPTDPAAKASFIPGSITEIAKMFGINDRTIQQEFNRVVKVALTSESHCANRKSNPLYYWVEVIRNVPMTKNLKYVLQGVLSIPFSSAEAERV